MLSFLYTLLYYFCWVPFLTLVLFHLINVIVNWFSSRFYAKQGIPVYFYPFLGTAYRLVIGEI